MNLGNKIKPADLYPSMGKEKEQTIYPCVNLPYKLCPDCELDDELTITLKGRVKSINLNEYSQDFVLEITEGDAKEVGDSAKEDKAEGDKS